MFVIGFFVDFLYLRVGMQL